MTKIKFALLAFLSFLSINIFAQESRSERIIKSEKAGWEYRLNTGFNIGGTSPLPLPVEIRSINNYNPEAQFFLEAMATRWFKAKPWGLSIGLRVENKGMTTDASVKNYGMEIINDGTKVKGNWTGNVETTVNNSYLTLPILLNYSLNDRFIFNFGPYISYKLSGQFSGSVYDGYLREGDPTGEKVEFKDGKMASYDFSNELRTVQYGLQLGESWRAYKHLYVISNLTWGLNDVFKKDFNTISFNMYPIY